MYTTVLYRFPLWLCDVIGWLGVPEIIVANLGSQVIQQEASRSLDVVHETWILH